MTTQPLIVLVEDDVATAQLTAHALQRLVPCAVHTCATVNAALLRCAQGDADLVITDYQLPDGDGLQIVTAVGQQSPAPPVIMITGVTDPQVEQLARGAGVSAYLTKPINVTTLLQAVRGALP